MNNLCEILILIVNLLIKMHNSHNFATPKKLKERKRSNKTPDKLRR